MSIYSGKDGYNSSVLWRGRSDVALLKRTGKYDYETSLGDGPDVAIEWMRAEVSRVSPAPEVLEIGSGFGGWSKKLQGYYNAYTGAEIMPERVAHARELHENEHAKFERITGPDWDMMRTFDVVFTVTVIQHLEMDKAEIVMRQIERHLKSTGKALLVERHIYDCSLDEAERMYDNTAAHMIPKPLYLLKEAAPSLTWEQAGEYNYILRKTL